MDRLACGAKRRGKIQDVSVECIKITQDGNGGDSRPGGKPRRGRQTECEGAPGSVVNRALSVNDQ